MQAPQEIAGFFISNTTSYHNNDRQQCIHWLITKILLWRYNINDLVFRFSRVSCCNRCVIVLHSWAVVCPYQIKWTVKKQDRGYFVNMCNKITLYRKPGPAKTGLFCALSSRNLNTNRKTKRYATGNTCFYDPLCGSVDQQNIEQRKIMMSFKKRLNKASGAERRKQALPVRCSGDAFPNS